MLRGQSLSTPAPGILWKEQKYVKYFKTCKKKKVVIRCDGFTSYKKVIFDKNYIKKIAFTTTVYY